MPIILNLNELMKEKGISVGELADKIRISPVNLSNIKNNKISAIRFSTLDAICRELDCQPGDMLEYQVNEKKKVIPMFLDYSGTTDLLLRGGAENVKRFFDSIIAMQNKLNCEVQITMVTGSSLESAKSKYKHLSELAENYGLENLFSCAIAEYCGFAIRKDTCEKLLTLDTNILQNRAGIESIAEQYGGKISDSVTSLYNIGFDEITSIELARFAEDIEKLIGNKDIETVTYYDDYGKECDVKHVNHTKPRAVFMVMEQLLKKYDVPFAIIGGDSQKEDLKMYTENKQKLENLEIRTVFMAPSNIDEINKIDEMAKTDKNIIVSDWENSDGIAEAINILNSRIQVREDGGLEL